LAGTSRGEGKVPIIHRSAWKGSSPKFGFRILYPAGPIGPETPRGTPSTGPGPCILLHDWIDIRLGGWWRGPAGVKGTRGLGLSVALYGPAHHLEHLACYRGV
jgi:hypothetical protein